MESILGQREKDSHRWLIFFSVSLVYFFAYFHRVSTSVIASDLLKAFDTNATALGIMSSMYFYLYAFEQPVVGYLTDRLGPRRVIGYWTLVAAAGCFLFGIAPTIEWASIGRALIGIGVGGVYVPAIKAFSLWFSKKDFSTFLGILMSVGNFGAVIATTPLAWAADTWGWRNTFFFIGGISVILAILTLIGTRDYNSPTTEMNSDPQEKTIKNKSWKNSNAVQVVLSGQFWITGLIFFGIYGTLVTLQGLWATPFLLTIGIDRMLASKINMLIPIGVIVGAPLFGWLPNRFALNLRNVLIAIITVYTVTWICLVFFFTPIGTAGLSFILFLMGCVTGGFITVLWGIVRETTPTHILGLTSGMLNPAPFLGVAIFQVITGTIIDKAGVINGLYQISSFIKAFTVCLIGIGICLGLSFFIRKPK